MSRVTRSWHECPYGHVCTGTHGAAAPTEPPPGGETHVQADRAAALASVPPSPDRGAGLSWVRDDESDDERHIYRESPDSEHHVIIYGTRDEAERMVAALLDSEGLDVERKTARAIRRLFEHSGGGRYSERYILERIDSFIAARLTKHPEEPA